MTKAGTTSWTWFRGRMWNMAYTAKDVIIWWIHFEIRKRKHA